MSSAGEVSEVTARRLSLYLRGLQQLESDGVRTISSHDFARRFHLNSAQIRKDLAMFGGFGIRGVGYDVANLKGRLVALLGIDAEKSVILCGAGHLGQALAGYGGFNSAGFRVVALFDVDPAKVGTKLKAGLAVHDGARLREFLSAHTVDIGVIAVPADAAQSVADQLVEAGIKAIMNFAPVQITVPPDVVTRTVNMALEFEALSFALANRAG